MACVRSGISGWVIGLLIRGRAGAERRAANSSSPWSPVLADGEAAAAFLFGHARSAVAELFGKQPLATAGRREAFGCARTLLDFGIGRARPLLESSSERGRVNHLVPVSSCAREGGPSASGFDPAAPAPAMGTLRREPIETAGRGGLWRVCALAFSGWVIGLLIRGRSGAERRAAK